MSEKPYLSLGEAIDAFLKAHGIEEETKVQQIIGGWEAMMGAPIAQNTEKLWFNKGTFYVKVKSHLWRSELQMARLKIKHLINEKLGEEIVTEVRVL